jgi:hypothetical protein
VRAERGGGRWSLAAATKTLELFIAQSEVTLRNLQQQAHVPEDQMVATFVVSPPSAPAAGMSARTRSAIAIFAAGFGLAVVVTVLIDVLLSRRRRRIEVVAQAKPAATGPSPNRSARDVHPSAIVP